MGTFTTPIEITDLLSNRFAKPDAIGGYRRRLHNGSENMVAGLTLISPENREFILADESKVKYPVGYLRLRFEDREVFALGIVAPEGTTPLLGGTALENALLAVNAYNERLIPIPGNLRLDQSPGGFTPFHDHQT